jgi:hypothetical protein
MILSSIIVFGINFLNTIIKEKQCNKVRKRLTYLRELVNSGKIDLEKHCLDDEPRDNNDIDKTLKSRNTKVVLYGKVYTDKTSWFVMENNILWIIGKKEDFLVQLTGRVFDNF